MKARRGVVMTVAKHGIVSVAAKQTALKYIQGYSELCRIPSTTAAGDKQHFNAHYVLVHK